MRRPGYIGNYDGIFDWLKPKKKETPPEVIAAKEPAEEAAPTEERPEGCPACPPCPCAPKEKKADEEKGWFKRWFGK